MSEFSTQQRTVTQTETGKTSIPDDDFFNLNQPSDARQELFDNYNLFYEEQAQFEASSSVRSRSVSIEKARPTRIEAGERRPQFQLRVSNFLDAPGNQDNAM